MRIIDVNPDDKIVNAIGRGDLILFENVITTESFLYDDEYRILIRVNSTEISKSYNSNVMINDYEVRLNGKKLTSCLLKSEHAKSVFHKIARIQELRAWHVNTRLWFVDEDKLSPHDGVSSFHVYNGTNGNIEKIDGRDSYILRVIYLNKDKTKSLKSNPYELTQYGLTFADDQPTYINGDPDSGLEKPVTDDTVTDDISKLLNCDTIRCGLAKYDSGRLYGIKEGHWDVFENEEKYKKINDKLIPRDPKKDWKNNGVIGIDFGTKSTVVVKQEDRNEIRPMRIGSLSLNVDVSENDYENPTVISFINVENFLNAYLSVNGRPETSCNDLFVSYNAYEDYKNCPTENFYAYYSDLKQWANCEKHDVVVQDIKGEKTYRFSESCSIDDDSINPIELYAYYIGMYINNMRNGIYTRYMMSFPVKYSKETKEFIRKSFEKGLKKSLPSTILNDEEIMKKFTVDYHISEPAAYAVTALEQSGFKPKNENEKYLYGIFDFGGGTTDFDFGVWRGASDEEYDKYNCDYVLECFGADSDANLGGEKILELLAYHVYKNNKQMASENKIACALPAGEVAFIGGENLINNSQSANRNLTLLKEAFRPLWEQQDNWEENYKKSSVEENADSSKCFISLQMYNFEGKPVPNCEFVIDIQELLELIKGRIKQGVDAFFNCIEKAIVNNKVAQTASEKVYIFLAGNSCKSKFVKELFEENISSYNKEYAIHSEKESERFELIAPMQSGVSGDNYVPNAKTSVAYGLVKSRPGGKIYIIKNYETNSDEETRFRYYLGTDRRGNFECKLTPMYKDENGNSVTSYNVWFRFQGAGVGIARIYYTENPSADSSIEKMIIDDIPFIEIEFEPDPDKSLFVRAISPNTIEYAIAYSEDRIEEFYEKSII